MNELMGISPMGFNEILNNTKMSPTLITKFKEDFENKGWIKVLENGKYDITDKGRAEFERMNQITQLKALFQRDSIAINEGKTHLSTSTSIPLREDRKEFIEAIKTELLPVYAEIMNRFKVASSSTILTMNIPKIEALKNE